MSGFVAGYGKPDPNDVEIMFKRISHRGPYLSGIRKDSKTIMAQNYLRGDLNPGSEGQIVPFHEDAGGNIAMCYDGQMGNWQDMAEGYGIPDGPFREERTLLALYVKHDREMFRYLDDTIFTFFISDGREILAARDLLGIKTLFYAWKDDTLYLASELKSLAAITQDIYEFPPGHYMDRSGNFTRYASLMDLPSEYIQKNVEQMTEDIRGIIIKSVRNRINFEAATAGLLSGGMDSSVINYLATGLYKEKFGSDKKLRTFAIGMSDSSDIRNARIMAKHIDSDHTELIITLEDTLNVLDEVIYSLESFDPSLVRSSISNFLISQYAMEYGIEVLLSGEGGDEVFCGYTYLKEFPSEEMRNQQIRCLDFLHSNASLRLDRMNQCHSIRVVAPLISGELLTYAMRIPPEYKQRPENGGKVEKWIFRKAYEGVLPDEIIKRTKQEFSQGSGSAGVLPAYFESKFSNAELEEAQKRYSFIRSKEELYYFRTFIKFFGEGKAVDTVGQWIVI